LPFFQTMTPFFTSMTSPATLLPPFSSIAQPVRSRPLKIDLKPSPPRLARSLFASSAPISRMKRLRQCVAPPWVCSWIGPRAGTGRRSSAFSFLSFLS